MTPSQTSRLFCAILSHKRRKNITFPLDSLWLSDIYEYIQYGENRKMARGAKAGKSMLFLPYRIRGGRG